MTLRQRLKQAWAAFFAKPVAKPERNINDVNLSDADPYEYNENERIQLALNRVFCRKASDDLTKTVTTQDSANTKAAMDNDYSCKTNLGFFQNTIPTILLAWFARQSFIGYQTCEILAQHWLIKKACEMPAEDASCNGYEITVNDGTKVPAEVLDAIKKADERLRVNFNLVELVRNCKVFGIRIVIFDIQYPGIDPNYYEKPFNIKGVKPGSYKGITQVEPLWMTPELDIDAAANPASKYFYEPTWWRVNGQRYHRTHLIVVRNGEVGDLLKPTYFYGGIPLPQMMYEAVYNACRSLAEAPMLLQTKRTGVTYTDIESAMVNQGQFQQRQQQMAFYRDNFQTRFLDLEKEKYEQHDTALADVDTTIMTQFQLCASIAEIPATKLLGTTLRGLNPTGEFEEASYHKSLKSIQTHFMTPLLERHHLLLIASEICPEFKIPSFSITATWNPLDSTTSKSKAENNKANAEADATLVGAGILSPDEPRKRLANDPNSGYNGLISEESSMEDPLSEEAAANSGNPVNESGGEINYAQAPTALEL